MTIQATTATGKTILETAPTSILPDSLGRLFAPDLLQAFLNTAYKRDRFHAKGVADGFDGLFSWALLNETLAENRLSPPRLRLERAGRSASEGVFVTRRTRRGRELTQIDTAVLNAQLREGATLILDSAQEFSRALRDICDDLARALWVSAQANLYACWGATQGFDVHWDDHDVFILQIAGTKTWHLYGAGREAPMQRDHHWENSRPIDPIETLDLAPGDLLYLPRGYWHAAIGRNEPTMHLTLGLTHKTGVDLLHWLVGRMVTSPVARRDLPMADGVDAVSGSIDDLTRAMTEMARSGELAAEYYAFVASQSLRRGETSFPDIGSPGMSAEPSLRISPSLGVRVLPTSEGARFSVAYQSKIYELDHRVAFTFDGSATVGDLEAAVGSAQAQRFIRAMMADGLLYLSGDE